MRRSLPLLAAAFLTGYLAFFAPGSARAAAFTVNSTIDAVDANPGDGACASASGECTLRAAVPETNAMPGPNTILMPAGTYLLSIFGGFDDAAASGDLDVNDNLEINGAGAGDAVIDLGSFTSQELADFAFHVHPSAVAAVSGLTIQRAGHILSPGGGILNEGDLTLDRSVLRKNTADSGAGVLNAGGVLTVTNSSFIENAGGTGSPRGAAS